MMKEVDINEVSKIAYLNNARVYYNQSKKLGNNLYHILIAKDGVSLKFAITEKK